jgi:DNA-binding transcriptional MerR regulator
MSGTLFEGGVSEIPDKLFFRPGEVSRLVGVPAHVLRYWETEFPELAPRKSGRGHRMYRRQDVELLFLIKELLHVKRFTIQGARQYLRQQKQHRKAAPPEARQADLFETKKDNRVKEIRAQLEEILQLLR